jgi:hypothetical protein
MLAEHVRLLGESRRDGKTLVVEILNGERPLLSVRARAELVAALAMVELVVIDERAEVRSSVDDQPLSQAFVEHALRRHRQERDKANGQ